MAEDISKTPFEERVKSGILSELGKANTEEDKKNLFKLLLALLRDSGVNSNQAVSEANRVGSGIVPPHAKDQKEQAASPILKLVHVFKKMVKDGDENLEKAFYDAAKEAGMDAGQIGFLTRIVSKNHNADTAAFVADISAKIITNKNYLKLSKNQNEKTDLQKDIENIKNNKAALQFLVESLSEAAEGGELLDTEGNKITSAEVVDMLIDPSDDETRRSVANSMRESASMADGEFVRLFDDATDKNKKKAMEFYEAIKTSNADVFKKYYKEKLNKIIKDNPKLSREEAGKKLTTEIHETISFIVYTIYSTTLKKNPEGEFDQMATEMASGYVGPKNVFNSVISGGLSRLLDSVSEEAGDNEPEDQDYYVHDKDGTLRYNPDRQMTETVSVPTARLVKKDLKRFVDSLKEISEVEKESLAYQFNLRFIMNNPPPSDKGGIFKAIQEFAKRSLKTETIDYLYFLPNNELIQAAVMSLEPMYKRMFASHGWRKTDEMQTAFLEHAKPAEMKALEQLHEAFGKEDGYDAWKLERAFNMARLMSFGKEFMYQVLSSYADPFMDDKGEPTFKGEGDLDSNAVFDIWSAAKRWRYGDPGIVGLPFAPSGGVIDKWHPEEMEKAGRQGWKDSFKHGTLAYYDNEYFREYNPLITLTNVSGQGGAEAMGGWRVKSTYMPWIDDITDRGTYSLKLDSGVDVFSKGWKSIQNIGTNVLKNYFQEFVISSVDFDSNRGHYEHFMKFLYNRYFAEGVGVALNNDGSENAFWRRIENSIDKGESYKDVMNRVMHDVLTVALYERMPTEFLHMERRRASQNGVTLEQGELMLEFIGAEGRAGKWTQGATTQEEFDRALTNKWDIAIDDLMYVQQKARMISIEQMKKRYEAGEDANKIGILYGDDINSLHGDIDYRVDSAFIERVLNKKYDGDPEKAEKVKRVKEIYESMTQKIVSKPKEGELETKWKNSTNAKDRKKYQEVRSNHIQNRMRWFSDTWRTGQFGMEFTTSEAGQFLNRSASGEELVSRAAGACFDITQSLKDYVAGGALLKGITKAVRKGQAGWEEMIKDSMSFYSSAKNEDTGVAKKLLQKIINWQIMAMRRDSRYSGVYGKWDSRIAGKRTSLAAKKVDRGGITYDWKQDTIAAYVMEYTKGNTIPGWTKETEMKFKEDPETGKLIRDFASETSGDALLHMHGASAKENFMRNIPTFLGLLILAILWIYIQKVSKEQN